MRTYTLNTNSNINNPIPLDSPSPAPPRPPSANSLRRVSRRSVTPTGKLPPAAPAAPVSAKQPAPGSTARTRRVSAASKLPKPLPIPSSPGSSTVLAPRARFPSGSSISVSDSRPPVPPLPPLALHDRSQQHVLSLTATTAATTTRSTSLSVAPASPKMPPDSRQRPPHLSAAAAKNVGRAPLTPKIASVKGPPTFTPGLAPAIRRPVLAQTPVHNYRDDSSTPSSGFRGDSRQSTPNSTPNPEKSHDGFDPRAVPAVESGRQPSGGSDSADSKFFYASDARSQQQQPQQPPQQPPPGRAGSQKPATFFYANGAATQAKRTTSPPTTNPHTPSLAAAQDAHNKFFYANGAPDVGPKSSPQPFGPPSAGSSNSRLTSGRPSTSGSAAGTRPMSPVKMVQQMPPALKGAASPGLNGWTPVASPPTVAASTFGGAKRRVSIESSSTPRGPTKGHARVGSNPSLDSSSPKVPTSASQHPSEPSSPQPASPVLAHPTMTMASMLQMVEDLPDDDSAKDDGSHEELHSPTKSTHSQDPISELVANARRERKVQDLEIRNASLEAINRTLERNLRKQTAELRRYRRLSRSNHIALSAASSRVASEALTDIPISLSDLSEEGEESGFSDEDPDHDSFDDSDFSSADLGSHGDDELVNEKASARRTRDEHRLQLDLTKHRELLVDSQKMNQSLKRCLNWTDVLIKEGQKALSYSVRVSDVELGGHVLAPPDEEEENDSSKLDIAVEESGPREKSAQDRDSGIELQAESS